MWVKASMWEETVEHGWQGPCAHRSLLLCWEPWRDQSTILGHRSEQVLSFTSFCFDLFLKRQMFKTQVSRSLWRQLGIYIYGVLWVPLWRGGDCLTQSSHCPQTLLPEPLSAGRYCCSHTNPPFRTLFYTLYKCVQRPMTVLPSPVLPSWRTRNRPTPSPPPHTHIHTQKAVHKKLNQSKKQN